MAILRFLNHNKYMKQLYIKFSSFTIAEITKKLNFHSKCSEGDISNATILAIELLNYINALTNFRFAKIGKYPIDNRSWEKPFTSKYSFYLTDLANDFFPKLNVATAKSRILSGLFMLQKADILSFDKGINKVSISFNSKIAEHFLKCQDFINLDPSVIRNNIFVDMGATERLKAKLQRKEVKGTVNTDINTFIRSNDILFILCILCDSRLQFLRNKSHEVDCFNTTIHDVFRYNSEQVFKKVIYRLRKRAIELFNCLQFTYRNFRRVLCLSDFVAKMLYENTKAAKQAWNKVEEQYKKTAPGFSPDKSLHALNLSFVPKPPSLLP